jgi:hypothetical protein
MLRDFSSGDSLFHSGFDRFRRMLPEKTLPPRLVTMLITPPEKRPYSAEMPDVRTCVSSMASSMNTLFAVPNRLSFTSTPSTRNTLSYANPPEIVTCPTFGVLSVSPGANSAMRAGVRPTGIVFNSRDVK